MDLKLDAEDWQRMEALATENRRSLVGQVSYAVQEWLKNNGQETWPDGVTHYIPSPSREAIDRRVIEEDDGHPFG